MPLTGRTHQIRVHLASLGHPLVGDKIYGPNEQWYLRFIETGWTPELERALLLPRHALHSARLEIEGVGKWASALPPDLEAWMNAAQLTMFSRADKSTPLPVMIHAHIYPRHPEPRRRRGISRRVMRLPQS